MITRNPAMPRACVMNIRLANDDFPENLTTKRRGGEEEEKELGENLLMILSSDLSLRAKEMK